MARSKSKVNVVFVVGLLLGISATVAGVELFKSVTSFGEPIESLATEPNSAASQSEDSAGESASEQSSGSLPTAREIEDILQSSADFEHPLILNSLLVDADEEALSLLLNQSEHLDSSRYKSDLQKGIVRALALTDPRLTLARIASLQYSPHGVLIVAVFDEWATANLDEAVEFARDLENQIKPLPLKAYLVQESIYRNARLSRLVSRWLIRKASNKLCWLS